MNNLLPRECPDCKGTGLVEAPKSGTVVLIGTAKPVWTCRTCGGEKMLWTSPAEVS